MSYTKINNHLPEDPDVVRMAKALDVPAATVVGGLMLFWRATNLRAKRIGETDDLCLDFNADTLDAVVGVPGFAKELPTRWLRIQTDGTLVVPDHWDRCDQKTKLAEAKRKAAQRAQKGNVPPLSHPCPVGVPPVSHQCPAPNSNSSSNNNSNTNIAAKAAGKPPKRKRKTDPLSDAWRDRFYAEGVPKSQGSKFGKEVATLRELGAEPGQVTIRAKNYHLHFADAALTPTALVKHWQTCAQPPPATGRSPARVHDDDQNRFAKRKPDVIA